MLGCNARRIAIISHLLNATSVICLLACLLTNSWLVTEERVADQSASNSNQMSMGMKTRNVTYLKRLTESGMWRFCQQDPQQPMDCFWIEHHVPDHTKLVDPRNATTCILYATMISMPSLLSAATVTLIGLITNALIKFRKIWIFVTGIIYITAGICTATCLVLFLTYAIQELDHKDGEKGADGEPIFTSSYGYSLILAIISFCCAELGGISLIYLSVSLFNAHWNEKERQLQTRQRQLHSSFLPPESHADHDNIIDQLQQQMFPASNRQLHHFATQNNFPPQHHSCMELTEVAEKYQLWNGRLSPRINRKSLTVPDLDVRTRDIYTGNHYNCSYNTTYRTPFGLAVSPKTTHAHVEPSRASAHRQVKFSDTQIECPSYCRQPPTASQAYAHHNSNRRQHQMPGSSGGRISERWRMTPV